MTATDLFPRDTAGPPVRRAPDAAPAPRRRSTGTRDRARRQGHRRVHRPDDRLQRLDPRPDPPRRPRVRDHRRRHEQRGRRDDRPLARPPARQPLRRRPGRHPGTDRDRRRLLVPPDVPGSRLLLVSPPSPRGLRPGDGDVRDDHRRARRRHLLAARRSAALDHARRHPHRGRHGRAVQPLRSDVHRHGPVRQRHARER